VDLNKNKKIITRISVIGLGAWGTALAQHLSKNESLNVIAWHYNDETVEKIKRTRENHARLPGVLINESVLITSSIKEASSSEFFLITVPSSYCASIVAHLTNYLNPQTVKLISGVKGILKDGRSPFELFSQLVSDNARIAVLSGPCFAHDLATGKPASLVVSSSDEQYSLELQQIFTGDAVRIYTSTDVKGVELGGILKNIIACAVGISDGLGLGDSARAALITRGLSEIIRYCSFFGVQKETLYGLTGLGDLVMTSSSDQSRNRQYGIKVGRSGRIPMVDGTSGVVEALNTLPSITRIARENNIEMPIAFCLEKILSGDILPNQAVKDLLSRPAKPED
jgi:glycerol-3-phosphate dehydrogenase (NAD(P)+)